MMFGGGVMERFLVGCGITILVVAMVLGFGTLILGMIFGE